MLKINFKIQNIFFFFVTFTLNVFCVWIIVYLYQFLSSFQNVVLDAVGILFIFYLNLLKLAIT